MSGKKSSPFTSNDWLALQQQMLDTWVKSMGQLNSGQAAPGSDDPVSRGMAQWWKTVSGSLPDGSPDFINKLMEQGRIYYMLGEQFTNLLNILNDINKISGDWQQALNEHFDEMKNQFESLYSNSGSPMGGVLGAWQLLPMDTLQRTFSFASLMPGDFLQDVKPENLESVTDKFLSIPGVGYTREHQEQIQQGIRLWNDYQKVSQEYNAAMCNIGVKAFDTMKEKIYTMAKTGEDITSLRQIYDLWVDCNEEVYSEYAYSDDFSELYGRLTNALMAVKHYGRNTIDELFSALSMPTHRTINTMQKRQQEMRREQKNNRLVIEKLQQELTDLKRKTTGSKSSPVVNKQSVKSPGKKKKTKSIKKTSVKKTGQKKAGKTKAASVNSGKKSAATRKASNKKKKTASGRNKKIVIKI